MPEASNIKFTIAFTDPGLDLGEKEEQARRLVCELREMDELEAVDRIITPDSPKVGATVGGMLLGSLTAEVSISKAKEIVRVLSCRLADKLVQLSVESNGKKLEVTSHKIEDLEAAIQKTLNLANRTTQLSS